MLMNDVDPINEAAKQSGFKNVDRYRARCEFLFQGLSFDGKRVLDVGCGAGALALWAGIHRASHVLGIEPESGRQHGWFAGLASAIDQMPRPGEISRSRTCLP